MLLSNWLNYDSITSESAAGWLNEEQTTGSLKESRKYSNRMQQKTHRDVNFILLHLKSELNLGWMRFSGWKHQTDESLSPSVLQVHKPPFCTNWTLSVQKIINLTNKTILSTIQRNICADVFIFFRLLLFFGTLFFTELNFST